MPQSLPHAHPSVPISRHSEAHPLSHRLARLTSVVQRRHYPQCLPGREPHQPPPVNVVCYTSRAPVEDHPIAPPPCCRAPCRDDDQPHVLQNPACPSLFPHHFLPSFFVPRPNAPSCGTQAWSVRRNRSACGRNASYLCARGRVGAVSHRMRCHRPLLPA